MMMEAAGKTTRYAKSKQEADSTLGLLETYVASMATANISKGVLVASTTEMRKKYDAFKQYTDNVNKESEYSINGNKNIAQELFDNIFSDYKKLYYHHTEQRKRLLIESHDIQYSIKILQIVMITITITAGLLIILYLDRVTLKVFDITEKLALRDKLTGLYNRHALDRFIAQLYPTSSEAPKNEYGLIILDIDHFKKFNDTYGHSAGDMVLIEIAKKLSEMVRTSDKVIRFGGEEMVIILPRTNVDGTAKVAKKIGMAIGDTRLHILEGTPPKRITVSIGYASYPNDKGSFQTILDIADRRLYIGKNNGRNTVVGPDQDI